MSFWCIYFPPKKCCGGLFADDVVLIAPGKPCLRTLLNKVHEWGIRNEMTFGINKCATMVIEPLYYNSPPILVGLILYLGIHPFPKTNQLHLPWYTFWWINRTET